jgi:hypothetical protein
VCQRKHRHLAGAASGSTTVPGPRGGSAGAGAGNGAGGHYDAASAQEREVVLRFRGLPFAPWRHGRVFFDFDGLWAELTKPSEVGLKQLVMMNLQTFRHPVASETRHPLYCGQSERWLQSIVQRQVSRVDMGLDPGPVYDQMFAQAAGQRGILDLLGVTRIGRLAILELKTTEDLDLPPQAADYWSRIRRHQEAGDLALFPGSAVASGAADRLSDCAGAAVSSVDACAWNF